MNRNQGSRRIVHVTLDERTVLRRSPEIDHERAVAIFDLLEDNEFAPAECLDEGPFSLHLRIQNGRLVLDIRTEGEQPLSEVMVPLTPFRTLVRDYFLICESYYNAIKRSSPARIEALDMGRRGIHNEGAELLRERLSGKIACDFNTARRLFTLICVLHIRG